MVVQSSTKSFVVGETTFEHINKSSQRNGHNNVCWAGIYRYKVGRVEASKSSNRV